MASYHLVKVSDDGGRKRCWGRMSITRRKGENEKIRTDEKTKVRLPEEPNLKLNNIQFKMFMNIGVIPLSPLPLFAPRIGVQVASGD